MAVLTRAFYWLCAGVGFDLSQRVLDHFIDRATDGVPWLAWLQ